MITPCKKDCSLEEFEIKISYLNSFAIDTIKLCSSCFRTSFEIEHWVNFSEETKKQVLASLKERKKSIINGRTNS